MKTRAQAEKEAKSIVNKWAAVAIPTGMIPGSPLLLPALDAKLINDIASCFEVHNYHVETVIGVVTTSIAGRTAADIALSTIPVAGWIIKGFVAGSATKLAGEIIIEYFRERTSLQ